MTTEALTLISMFVVRLAVPLFVTFGIGIALARWDERKAARDA